MLTVANSKLSIGLVLLATVLFTAQEQPIRERERAAVREMLSEVKADLKNNYYDPKFHGVDIDARLEAAARTRPLLLQVDSSDP